MPSFQGTHANICTNLILPENRLSAKHFFCWQYRFFFNSFHTIWKPQSLTVRHTAANTEFNVKQSFKVIRGHTFFGISEKLRDCISLYNNVGLISKVSEDIARQRTENCCCRQSHCHLMPLSRKPQGYVFSLLVRVYQWALKDACVCNRHHKGHSRLSKVVDFGTNQRAYVAFY